MNSIFQLASQTSSASGQPVPLVSIIIPCFNRAPLVGNAIRSALREGPDVEVIVVDDGSTDGSASVAARYDSVRVVSTENRGPSAARNTGLEQSSGDFIRFLDSDDQLASGSTAILLKVVNSIAPTSLAFGDATSSGARGDSEAVYGFAYEREGLLSKETFLSGVMNACLPLFPSSALRAVGGFNPALRLGEDFELACRLLAHGCGFHHIRSTTYLVGHDADDRLSRGYGSAGYFSHHALFSQCIQILEQDQALSAGERAALARQVWSVARGASRDRFRPEAERLFDLANALGGKSARVGSLPLRLGYRLLAPFTVERLAETAKNLTGQRR